jgi:hypothetical protein
MEEAPPLVRQHHEDIENSKVTIGTTKKSVETNCFAWVFRKGRHVGKGGFR